MVFSAINSLLDPFLSPLLNLDPLLSIIIISFIISLSITLAYRKLTDQDLMKDLKGEIKELQKEMKTLKDKPEQMMKVQKQAMDTNLKYMMHSLKPTLYTLLPILLIFGWLNSHMAFFPIVEDQQFTSTVEFQENVDGSITIILPNGVSLVSGSLTQEIAANKAEWALIGEKGEYILEYEFDGNTYGRELIITGSKSERKYAPPEVTSSNNPELRDSGIEKIVLSNERIKPLENIPIIGSIPWISNFGWLGTYILFSIIFSISLRKIMKVY